MDIHVVLPTFFIRGASATVPSRLTKASPPFCCGSGRFIADPWGILTGFGVSKPRLLSPAFAEDSAMGEEAADEPASFLARLFPSDVGVTGEPAGASLPGRTSLSSTSAIFAATTWTDIAAVSQSPFSNTNSESSGCALSKVHCGPCSFHEYLGRVLQPKPATFRMSLRWQLTKCHSTWE